MSYSLKTVTFVVPVRIESQFRMDNLKTILTYFATFFHDLEIILIENSPKAICRDLSSLPFVTYIHQDNHSPILHRTKMLNDGFRMSTRPYVSAYDTDVLFRPEAIVDLLRTMEEQNIAFAIPYNGVFLDIGGNTKTTFLESFDFSVLPRLESAKANENYADTAICIGEESIGGATFFNRSKLKRYGGYNENFVGWGFEDFEIANRFTKMGQCPLCQPHYNLYHLHHERGINSGSGHEQYSHNQNEYEKIVSMNKAQLVDYIKNELKW